jgi:hypothetical protein
MLLVTNLSSMGVVVGLLGAFVFPSKPDFVQQCLLKKSNFVFAS